MKDGATIETRCLADIFGQDVIKITHHSFFELNEALFCISTAQSNVRESFFSPFSHFTGLIYVLRDLSCGSKNSYFTSCEFEIKIIFVCIYLKLFMLA